MPASRNISYQPSVYFNVSYPLYPPQQKVGSSNRGFLSSSTQILNKTIHQPVSGEGDRNKNAFLKNVIPYIDTAILNLCNQALKSPNDNALKNSAIELSRKVINTPQKLTIFDYRNLLQALVTLKFKYKTHKELISEIIEKIFKIPPDSRLSLNEIARLLQHLRVDKEYIHNHVKIYLKRNFKKCTFNSINKLVMIDKNVNSKFFTKNYPNHPFFKVCLNVITLYHLGFTRPESDKYIDQIFSPLDPSHRTKPFIAVSPFNQVAQTKNAYSQVFPQSVPNNNFNVDASHMKDLLAETLIILIKMGYTSGTIQSQLNSLILSLTKDLNITYKFQELVILMELFVQLQAHEVPYCDEAIICLIKHSLPPEENQFEQVLNFLSCFSKITASFRKSNFDGFIRQLLNSLIKNPEDKDFCLDEKRIRPLLNLCLPIILHTLDLVQSHEGDQGITSFMTRLFTHWKIHFPYEDGNRSSHELNLLQLGQVHTLLSSYQLLNLQNSKYSQFLLNTISPSIESLYSAPQVLTISSKKWYETGLSVITKILNHILSLSEELTDKTVSTEVVFKLLQLYGKYTSLKTTESQIQSTTLTKKTNLKYSLHFISLIRSFIYISENKELDRLSIHQVFEGLKNNIETFNLPFHENLPNQSVKEETNSFKLNLVYLTSLEFTTLMNFLETEGNLDDAQLAAYRIKFLLLTNLATTDSFYPLLNQFNKIFNSPFLENSIKKNLIKDKFQKLNNQLLSSTLSDDLVWVEYIDCLFQYNHFFEISLTSSTLSLDFLKKQLMNRYTDNIEILNPSIEESLSPQEVKKSKNDSTLNKYYLSSFEFLTLMNILELSGSVDDGKLALYRFEFFLLTDISQGDSFYSLLNQFSKVFNNPLFKDSLRKGLIEDKFEELTFRLLSVSLCNEIIFEEYIDCLFQYNQFFDLSSDDSFIFIDFLKAQLAGNLKNITNSHLAKLIILLSSLKFDLQEDHLQQLFASSPISNPHESYKDAAIEFNDGFENSPLIEYLRIFPPQRRIDRKPTSPYRDFSEVPEELFHPFLDACKKLNIPSIYLSGASSAVQNSSRAYHLF